MGDVRAAADRRKRSLFVVTDMATDIRWKKSDGSVLACVEKLKVLRENMAELKQVALDALEDALLMGCDEQQVRNEFQRLLDNLQTDIRPQ